MHLPGSFPVLLQLGHVGDSGTWELCKECRGAGDSPERSSRELLSSEARGWHQEPAGYWKPISVGVSGAPGREMLLAGRCSRAGTEGCSCSQQQWGVNVQRAWGRGCLSSRGVPPCSKESQMCWKGAQTQQSETPAQARGGGHPPQPALGVVTRALSLSF